MQRLETAVWAVWQPASWILWQPWVILPTAAVSVTSYGMFKQKIEDGYQVEVPDNWLKDGNPFEIRRPEYASEVKFGGYVRVEYDEERQRNHFIQEGYQSVRAVPYDLPVVGYGNNVVNTLAYLGCRADQRTFHLDSFDKGDYQKAVEQENLAKNIC